MTNLPTQTMTLEAARQVLWLRKNRKPIGELIDQGYLKQTDLVWAAGKAYDPNLQMAAQVILAHQQLNKTTAIPTAEALQQTQVVSTTPLQLPVSIQQARETVWPFRELAGQKMGVLIDNHQLSLKDLGFAVENVRDHRVRNAAIVLMSVQLHQVIAEPLTDAGPVHVVTSGRSYSERRQYRYILLEGIFTGLLLAAGILIMIWSIGDLLRPRTDVVVTELMSHPLVIFGAIILIVLYAAMWWFLIQYLPDRVFEWIQRKIEQHRRGEEGEDAVLNSVQGVLDGQWHVFRNVMLPDRKGDIDLVLVGPTGVWAFEVKNLSGHYRYTTGRWEWMKNKRWQNAKVNPFKQAKYNATQLGNFFKADGIQQWVTPAVIWANPQSLQVVENPETAIWTLHQLQNELDNLWHGRSIANDVRERITLKLRELCAIERERQRTMFER